MNIQAMMKQAQKLQSDMMKSKDEIDKMEFTGDNGFVKVRLNGKKEVLEVSITPQDDFEKEDMEMLQDMIVLAINEAMKKIDAITDEKLGKFTQGMPGLF